MTNLPEPILLEEGIPILVKLGVPMEIFLAPTLLLIQEDNGRIHAPGSTCLKRSPDDTVYREAVLSLSEIPDNKACGCYYYDDVLPTWDVVNELLHLLTLLQRPLEEYPAAYYDVRVWIQDTLEHIDLERYVGRVPEACLAVADMLLHRLRDYLDVLLLWLRSEKAHQVYRELVGGESADALTTIGLHRYQDVACTSLEGAFVLTYGPLQPRAGTQLVSAPAPLVDHFLRAPSFYDLRSFSPQRVVLLEGDTPEITEVALALWAPDSSGALRELEAAFQAGRNLLR